MHVLEMLQRQPTLPDLALLACSCRCEMAAGLVFQTHPQLHYFLTDTSSCYFLTDNQAGNSAPVELFLCPTHAQTISHQT